MKLLGRANIAIYALGREPDPYAWAVDVPSSINWLYPEVVDRCSRWNIGVK